MKKEKYQQVQSKIEDYILSLKIVVQLNGSITKNQYYVDSEYLKINFKSEEGLPLYKFIDLIKDEYDIVSLKTFEKLK